MGPLACARPRKGTWDVRKKNDVERAAQDIFGENDLGKRMCKKTWKEVWNVKVIL